MSITGFKKNNSIAQFQELMRRTYSVPDDRYYSLWDLLINQERFAMRALKGIRKGDLKKLKNNLAIAFSWMMTIGNRLHIDVEKETWKRFPFACSYCKSAPCRCKKEKEQKDKKSPIMPRKKPETLSDFQKMFGIIYPSERRTLEEAGIHLAEEIGELSEAILCYCGEHKKRQFKKIEIEIADYVSCVFGVTNSARVDMATELSKIFHHGCQVCHKVPCGCNFSFVGKYKS